MSGGHETSNRVLGDHIAFVEAELADVVRQRDAVRATLDRVTGERDLLNAVVAKHLGLLGDALGSTVHREGDVVLVGPTVAAAIACVEALEKQRDEANQSLQGLVEALADATGASKSVVCGLRPGDEARALVEVVRKAFAKPKQKAKR